MKQRTHKALATGLFTLALCGCGGGSDGNDSLSGSTGLVPVNDAPRLLSGGFEIAPQFATGASASEPETRWHCKNDTSGAINVFHFGADGGGTIASSEVAEPLPIDWIAVEDDVDVTVADGITTVLLTEIEFETPVRFTTTFQSGVTPYADNVCELHSLDGTPQANAPFLTPYGPASYDRPSPSLAGAVPSELSMTMIYEFGVDGFGNTSFDRSAIMLFNDGSFTRNVAGVLLFGIDGSRVREAELWGDWRGDPATGSIELRERERDFDETSAVPGSPVQSNQPLEGCYESTESISVPGGDIGTTTDGFTSNVYCFFSDGVFSNHRTSTAVSSDVLAGASSDTVGEYRIEGNAIDFEFDDGTIARHVFGLYAAEGDPQFALSLNGAVLAKPLPE